MYLLLLKPYSYNPRKGVKPRGYISIINPFFVCRCTTCSISGFFFFQGRSHKITRANRLIAEAEDAYLNGHYVLALVKYRYLVNSLQLRNNDILLNLLIVIT
jgi:hypothetical protein